MAAFGASVVTSEKPVPRIMPPASTASRERCPIGSGLILKPAPKLKRPGVSATEHLNPELQVAFVDTFHLFPETHEFLHRLEVWP